jgi:hypothetical protein
LTYNKQLEPPKPKVSRLEVYWTAVTYKTVVTYVILGLIIVVATLYLLTPDWYNNAFAKVTHAIEGNVPSTAALTQRQAHFTNLDGRVQVKKVNSVQWVNADYHTSLDKGDLIQTGQDGAARISFADGTWFTVKSDTLVTVEENSMPLAGDRGTAVAVRVNTGAVDLNTGNWSSPQSTAAVSVEDATASVRQNSRLSAKNDPGKSESEIVLAQGSADVKRGNERVELAPHEKVTVPANGQLVKSNVLAPPDLLGPINLQPLIVENPKTTPIRFEWKPVPEAVQYTMRVSTTSMFTAGLVEKKVTGTTLELAGLDAGDYFWNVTATDAQKRTSEPSDTFRFTLVAQGKGQDMVLEVDQWLLHGKVAEIIGHTEPGAALMINGQTVANIQPDGHFRHFTEPLAPGNHEIVIIGQDRRGRSGKTQVSIVVPR